MCGDGGVGWFSHHSSSFKNLPAHHILSTVYEGLNFVLNWIHCYSPCFDINVWNILILVMIDFSLDFHIFLNRLNNIRAYPFLSLMSWSDSPFIAQICLLFAVLALVSEQFPRKSGKLQQTDSVTPKKKAKINRELKLEAQPYSLTCDQNVIKWQSQRARIHILTGRGRSKTNHTYDIGVTVRNSYCPPSFFRRTIAVLLYQLI